MERADPHGRCRLRGTLCDTLRQFAGRFVGIGQDDDGARVDRILVDEVADAAD